MSGKAEVGVGDCRFVWRERSFERIALGRNPTFTHRKLGMYPGKRVVYVSSVDVNAGVLGRKSLCICLEVSAHATAAAPRNLPQTL